MNVDDLRADAEHWKRESDLRSGIINHLQTALADARALRKDAPVTSGEPSVAAREAVWATIDAYEDGDLGNRQHLKDAVNASLDAFAVAAAEGAT